MKKRGPNTTFYRGRNYTNFPETWKRGVEPYLHAGMCQHMWTCRHALICADMFWYVPTCDITLGTCDTNHLDLICIPVCVSTCGHADMCWYVPTCANMCHHSRYVWYEPFGPYLHAGMCRHIWTCRHVLICADMCQHVASFSAPLIPTIWTLPPCWHVSAHVDMPKCANMCRHVPTCANIWHHSRHLWYQPFGFLLHVGMCQHMWTCRHVTAGVCRHVPTCSITLGTSDTNHWEFICMQDVNLPHKVYLSTG